MRLSIPTKFLPGPLRKLGTDENGVTAIEFAIVAGPFLFLFFGVVSVGFYFFAIFSIEHAVESASRVIRTGQAQNQTPNPMTVTEFKTLVCSKLPPFIKVKCSGGSDKIRVNVQNFTDFSGTPPSCTDGSGALIPTASQSFAPGGASAVVLVTVCFEWEFTQAFKDMAYYIIPTAARMASGSTLIVASTTFTTEPY